MTRRIPLPDPVSRIYKAVAELERRYPQRRFTPDGHLVGSIGEVIAAEALGLQLHPMSHRGHHAFDAKGDVQIKMTAGRSVAMYGPCERLVVLRLVSPEEAEIVYDGPGAPAWEQAGKNGQERPARHFPVAATQDRGCEGGHGARVKGFLCQRIAARTSERVSCCAVASALSNRQ
jgi:hypothetical protein